MWALAAKKSISIQEIVVLLLQIVLFFLAICLILFKTTSNFLQLKISQQANMNEEDAIPLDDGHAAIIATVAMAVAALTYHF